MIKRLTVENFQSHKYSVLEFCPGVNVIVGRSQAGKTALLRALQWVCFNHPRGLRFLSSFSDNGTVCVSLELEDNVIVELSKSEKDALYTLTKNGKSRRFRKFSTSVPDVISKVINLNSLNIQNQLEEPFLVLDSGGRVAQEISKLTHIEKVGTWVSSLNSMYLATNQNLKLLKEEREKIHRELENLSGLDKVEKLIQKGDKRDKKLKEFEKKYQFLSTWLNEIVQLQCELEKVSIVDVIEDKGEVIESIIEEQQSLYEEKELLQSFLQCLDRFVVLEENVSVIEDKEEVVKSISEQQRLFYEEKELLQSFLQCSSRFVVLESNINVLQELDTFFCLIREAEEKQQVLKQFIDLDIAIQEKNKVLCSLKEEYISIIQENKRCPLCFSDISVDQIEHIRKEI